MEPVSDRKTAAKAASSDEGKYEKTEHGRRRVTRVPKPLSGVWRLLSWPFRFVTGQLRGK